jgi:hypothetical protein
MTTPEEERARRAEAERDQAALALAAESAARKLGFAHPELAPRLLPRGTTAAGAAEAVRRLAADYPLLVREPPPPTGGTPVRTNDPPWNPAPGSAGASVLSPEADLRRHFDYDL